MLGVTIASLTGSDSAPAKANEAAQKNDLGTAKDDVQLAVTNALTDAYQTAYVKPGVSAGSASTTVGTEVIKAIAQKYQTNNQIGKATIEANSNGIVRIYTTDFEEKGEISTSGGVLTWKGITSNTGETILIEEPGPTIADITVADYGTYINIGTDILGKNNTTESDWRIFSKDTNGAWLILADYLPVNEGTVGANIVSTFELYTDPPYTVCSYPRLDLISKLNGDWSNLISGSDVEGKTGVIVKGALDLDTWKASWNASYSSNEIYTAQAASAASDELYGYYVGLSPNPATNSIDLTGITVAGNNLYFLPGTQCENNYLYGYWLSSPCIGTYAGTDDSLVYYVEENAISSNGSDCEYSGVRSSSCSLFTKQCLIRYNRNSMDNCRIKM